MRGNPNLFSLSIEPETNTVRFVNRMEEIQVVAIQTFAPYETDFLSNDIFYNYSYSNIGDTQSITSVLLNPILNPFPPPPPPPPVTFTVDINLLYNIGDIVTVTDLTISTNYFIGLILSYTPSTGNLTIDNILYISGSFPLTTIFNVNGPGGTTQSTTSVLLNPLQSNPSVSFTIPSNLLYIPGNQVTVIDSNNASNYFTGIIILYTPSGVLVINSISYISGSFPLTAIFNVSGGGNVPATYPLDTNYIYITLPYNYIVGLYGGEGRLFPEQSPPFPYEPKNPFPLVITDLNFNLGNINFNLFNYTEFYCISIYQNSYSVLYNENELDSISHYKFQDFIYISGVKYLRFGFKLSTGNAQGANYNKAGVLVIPAITENYVLNYTLNKLLIANSVIAEYTYINKSSMRIGRAILYRWIFDKENGSYVNYEFNTDNQKKRSILKLLAWPIANQTNQIFVLDINGGFRFVHTNKQSTILTKDLLDQYLINSNITINGVLTPTLNLQFYSGKYFFASSNYIFMKIIFNISDILLGQDNIVNAVSDIDIQYNQVYVSSEFFNVEIGGDYTCIPNYQSISIKKIDQTNIFAKILVSDVPGTTDTVLSNIINNNNFSINYENVIDNISNITVELYDFNLRLLDIKTNYSFTLEVHEIQDVLKETLINTKTNNVNVTGHFV